MNEISKVTQWECIKDGRIETFTPPSLSILEHIGALAAKYPEKEAIVGIGEDAGNPLRITYRELAVALKRCCGIFSKVLKLSSGDTVAVLMENKPELLVINWAAWASGLKTVPLDIKRDTPERKRYKLELSGSRVLFVRSDQINGDQLSRIGAELQDLRIEKFCSDRGFFDFIETGMNNIDDEKIESSKTDIDADCLIMFTSGSTAMPKGVRLTLRSMWANAAQIMDWLHLSNNDRFHILLPLHHINSTTFSLATILSGGTIILSPRYSKSRFWRTMAEHQATLASIVPTIAYDLLSEGDSFITHRENLKQVSRIQLGSAPVQVPVVLKFYEQYKIPLLQGYGSTETSLRCTGVPYGLSEEDYLDFVKSNTIGTEMRYNNVSILDQKCRELDEGVPGEICIRGPNVTRGYIDNPEQTKKAFRGGWYHSGDLGYWQEVFGRRLFFIKGRLKEIIIKGGVNISPVALESTIAEVFPEIEHCFVIGFPHERFGEEIGLLVHMKNGNLSNLKETIRTRGISGLLPYECPKAIIPVDYEKLPRTSTGKVHRLKLKEKYSFHLREELKHVE